MTWSRWLSYHYVELVMEPRSAGLSVRNESVSFRLQHTADFVSF